MTLKERNERGRPPHGVPRNGLAVDADLYPQKYRSQRTESEHHISRTCKFRSDNGLAVLQRHSRSGAPQASGSARNRNMSQTTHGKIEIDRKHVPNETLTLKSDIAVVQRNSIGE